MENMKKRLLIALLCVLAFWTVVAGVAVFTELDFNVLNPIDWDKDIRTGIACLFIITLCGAIGISSIK